MVFSRMNMDFFFKSFLICVRKIPDKTSLRREKFVRLVISQVCSVLGFVDSGYMVIETIRIAGWILGI